MKSRSRTPSYVVALLLIVALSASLVSAACTDDDPLDCGERPGPRLVESEGDVFSRIYGDLDEDELIHPHSREEMYVEVVSDATVRIIYERDEKVVVETYDVVDPSSRE